jgi:hypothetical protein
MRSDQNMAGNEDDEALAFPSTEYTMDEDL